ncbi:MAG: N-alpha-acetyl diaminobutyric acid deacetylase DoeB [Rhodospirillales bacterium]|nr:N-alpha-acetyl diaminobutyric acid deacetylase DoeB [Rhodospirillales bacterium]
MEKVSGGAAVVAAAFSAQRSNTPSRVSCTVDFEANGRQAGFMTVPHSRNDSAWGSLQIPIVCVKNGEGPTALFIGGSHGDEYEGPIALIKLAKSLSAADVSGRVIIIPCLNLPAVRTATRLSPIDGRNMNRVFPGNPEGTITDLIADFVYRSILPLADAVVDLHAGGKTLNYLPSVVMHHLDDPELMVRTFAALKSFGAPIGMILRELDTQGMLDTAVEEMGKIFISTELGGIGTSSATSVGIAERGVYKLLRHFGVLAGFADLSKQTRLMHTPDAAGFTIVAHAGILEMIVDLGDEVAAGDVLARIYDYEDLERPPAEYAAKTAGMVFCRHAPGLIQRGDCLAVIAQDMPPDLLASLI